MSANEQIVVKDSCILFDLIDLGLLSAFFSLELFVFTTDSVITEIENDVQMTEVMSYVNVGKLIIDSNGDLDKILEISAQNLGLSYTDSSVLELAIRLNAVLLSSDKTLRNTSVRHNIPVRGVLWIIEELCNKKIITEHAAIDKLNMYPEVNKRAPQKEISALLNRLKRDP